MGQLGHGDTEPRFYPRMVQHLQGQVIVSIAAGGGFSLVVNENVIFPSFIFFSR